MDPRIVRSTPASEIFTPERCFIVEIWNDNANPSVSIARSRVAPGVTTQLHSLDVDERYLMFSGMGEMQVGDLATSVGAGDVVVIPKGTPQRITNTGEEDLVFYCVCCPRFEPQSYQALE